MIQTLILIFRVFKKRRRQQEYISYRIHLFWAVFELNSGKPHLSEQIFWISINNTNQNIH